VTLPQHRSTTAALLQQCCRSVRCWQPLFRPQHCPCGCHHTHQQPVTTPATTRCVPSRTMQSADSSTHEALYPDLLHCVTLHAAAAACVQIMPAHVIASLHRELAAAAATSPAAAHAGQPQQPHPRRRTSAPATATTPPVAPAGSTAADAPTSSSGAPSGHSAAADGSSVQESQVPAVRAALRLARYSLARCGAVLGLMHRLASVPESFEMARATGLTLDQGRGRNRQDCYSLLMGTVLQGHSSTETLKCYGVWQGAGSCRCLVCAAFVQTAAAQCSGSSVSSYSNIVQL
jgi:hypothetical protein